MLDHGKFIKGLIKKGYKQINDVKITTRATGTEIEDWKREEVGFMHPNAKNFLNIGRIGVLVSFNTNKNLVFEIVPMLYVEEPFNLAITTSKEDSVLIYDKGNNPDELMDKALENLDELLGSFVKKLELLNSRKVTENDLVNLSKELLDVRFKPTFITQPFVIDLNKTDSKQVLKFTPELTELLKRNEPFSMLDAYISAFLNLLSDAHIKMTAVGTHKTDRTPATHLIRSNVDSMRRKRLLRHGLSEVFEQFGVAIKPVKEFKIDNYL